MKPYDAVVVGGGQAGPGVAATLVARGQRVALTESERLGSTCLNHGCRPTKALRATARAAWTVRPTACTVSASAKPCSPRPAFTSMSGRAPTIPPIDGLGDVAYLTEIELLQLQQLPEHLLVVGGGYIGLEFAQCSGGSVRLSP